MHKAILTAASVALGMVGSLAAQQPADASTVPDASPTAQAGPTDPSWTAHRALRILYAGKQGGQRQRAFGEFLARWFDDHKSMPLGKLTAETAAPFDLVIVDWVSQYGNDGYDDPGGGLSSAPVRLAADFTKPIIAMSYVGSQVRPQHKLDWL